MLIDITPATKHASDHAFIHSRARVPNLVPGQLLSHGLDGHAFRRKVGGQSGCCLDERVIGSGCRDSCAIVCSKQDSRLHPSTACDPISMALSTARLFVLCIVVQHRRAAKISMSRCKHVHDNVSHAIGRFELILQISEAIRRVLLVGVCPFQNMIARLASSW